MKLPGGSEWAAGGFWHDPKGNGSSYRKGSLDGQGRGLPLFSIQGGPSWPESLPHFLASVFSLGCDAP